MPVQTENPPRSTKSSSQPTDPRPGNVNLAGPWGSVRRLWWLVLVVAVAVTVIAVARAGSGPKLFRASTTLYVGQPISPTGVLMSTASAKAATAIEIAMGDESVVAAAKAANTSPAKIHSEIAAVVVSSPLASKLANPPALLRISVSLKDRTAANKAVEAIGNVVIKQTNSYASEKIDALNEDAELLRDSQKQAQEQFAMASKQVAAHPTGAEAAVWLSLLQTITIDRRQASTDLHQAENELRLAREIELTQVQSSPSATRSSTASKRPAVAFAVLLGLALGTVVAMVAGAFTDRRRTKN